MTLPIETTTHSGVTRTAPAEMAAFLQDLLGQRLTAVMVGQKDPKAIGQWARGAHVPRPEAERHLRDAYYIASLLMTQKSAETVRSWFTGMNPHLDDRTPVMVIAEGGAPQAMQAARAFLADAIG